MKKEGKRAIVCIFALAAVIAAGVYSSDHLLKATDGEENYVEADTSAGEPVVVSEETKTTEVEEDVTIEPGSMEDGETGEADKSVVIAYEVNGNNVGVGSEITLTAVPTGYENPVYQWQYYDGTGWKDIEGATDISYHLVLTEENCSYNWRVDVEEAQ